VSAPGDVAIQLDGVWKRYGVPLPPLLRRLLGSPTDPDGGPWALRDLSLAIRRGETYGVIGRNGAGKSTLLKVLAGVTPTTRGAARVSGRLFPMIELSAGLHPELNGRENILLLGAFMGLDRAAIRSRMRAIEEFSELSDWLLRPVRTWSSGMTARLGFSVAANVDADILLVDEVLAVGDPGFTRRCYDRIQKMSAAGVTIVLVSHNVRQIERLCERAALLHQGHVVFEGAAHETVTAFHDHLMPRPDGGSTVRRDVFQRARSSGELRVISAEIARPLRALEPFQLEFEIEVYEPEVEPEFCIAINNFEMQSVFAFTSRGRMQARLVEGRYRVRCTIPSLALRPGVYNVGFKIRGKSDHLIQEFKQLWNVELAAAPKSQRALQGSTGLAYTDHCWSLEAKP
jgi:ABC-type polysaccharide/polyol phosphate transport system ATPase subunit